MPCVLKRTASTGPSCPRRHAASLLGRCSLGGSSVSGGGAGPSGRGGMEAQDYRRGMAGAVRGVGRRTRRGRVERRRQATAAATVR